MKIQNNSLRFIAIHDNSKAVLRTACGIAEQISILDKVMQGRVWGVLYVQQQWTSSANWSTQTRN